MMRVLLLIIPTFLYALTLEETRSLSVADRYQEITPMVISCSTPTPCYEYSGDDADWYNNLQITHASVSKPAKADFDAPFASYKKRLVDAKYKERWESLSDPYGALSYASISASAHLDVLKDIQDADDINKLYLVEAGQASASAQAAVDIAALTTMRNMEIGKQIIAKFRASLVSRNLSTAEIDVVLTKTAGAMTGLEIGNFEYACDKVDEIDVSGSVLSEADKTSMKGLIPECL